MKNVLQMYERDDIEILCAKSTHTFPLHSHESYCIGLVRRGEVTFSINGVEKSLTQNDIYIIPSNTGVIIKSEAEYEYTTICIKHNHRNELFKYQVNSYYMTNQDSFNELLALCELYRDGLDAAEFVCGIVSVLEDVLEEKEEQNDSTSDFIEEAKTYIRNNLDEPFDLDELSNHVHISKFHLIRCFKREVGVTPNQFYTQSKMFEIKKAVSKNIQETEIAARLSFADQAHMCKQFKKQMGITIQDYKKNYERH